jgi:hypothetical protein
MADPQAVPPRRHLLISGTGRAGTSFLVHYLAALGLETHLSVRETPVWDVPAAAGFEDLPIPGAPDTMPYVVKSPWLHQHIDALLERDQIGIDAVIIPMRDLAEAAASRLVIERRAIHASNRWLAEVEQPWETWAHTAGGAVYSLHPIDQGRLLAVGFHHLVQRLVHADIPMVLLDFPRLALDADYLFGRLRRFLPPGVTLEAARTVHAGLAERDRVRIDGELRAEAESQNRPSGTPPDAAVAPGIAYPDARRLDRIALGRELQLLRGALAEIERARQQAVAEAESLRADTLRQAREIAALGEALAGTPPGADRRTPEALTGAADAAQPDG